MTNAEPTLSPWGRAEAEELLDYWVDKANYYASLRTQRPALHGDICYGSFPSPLNFFMRCRLCGFVRL